MLALSFSYILIAILLLNLGLYSNWSLRVKILIILITSAFYFISYWGFKQLSGWPTTESLPERFKILTTHNKENSKDHKGIYLWVQDLDVPDALPRAYKIPYDPETHKLANKVSKKRQEGKIVTARKQEGSQPGEDAKPSAAFKLITPPRPRLPEKN